MIGRERNTRFTVKAAVNSGSSQTQPNMAYDVAEIIARLQRGQTVKSTEMPIYLGEKFPEIIGFENLSLLEQKEFAKKYVKNATEIANKKKGDYESELAKAKEKQEKLLEKQKEDSSKL